MRKQHLVRRTSAEAAAALSRSVSEAGPRVVEAIGEAIGSHGAPAPHVAPAPAPEPPIRVPEEAPNPQEAPQSATKGEPVPEAKPEDGPQAKPEEEPQTSKGDPKTPAPAAKATILNRLAAFFSKKSVIVISAVLVLSTVWVMVWDLCHSIPAAPAAPMFNGN